MSEEMINSVNPHTGDQDTHVITLGAYLDVSGEHDLEAAVYHVQKIHGKHILLNLQGLKTIDSRGLGKLFLTYHHLHRNKIRLSFVSPRPCVREMLEFVNFSRIVPIYDSLNDWIRNSQDLEKGPSLPSGIAGVG